MHFDFYGSLTVSGDGYIVVPCRGKPKEVEVGFTDSTPPSPGCGSQEDDSVSINIERLRKPFPIWAIKISWAIKSGSTREVTWRASVAGRGF